MDIEEARDTILKYTKEFLEQNPETSIFDLHFENVKKDIPNQINNEATPWIIVRIRHTSGGQASLANYSGKKKYRTYGTLGIFINTPTGDGFTLADRCAKVVKRSLEGKKLFTVSGEEIWFNRVLPPSEREPKGMFFEVWVLAYFEYDDIH